MDDYGTRVKFRKLLSRTAFLNIKITEHYLREEVYEDGVLYTQGNVLIKML